MSTPAYRALRAAEFVQAVRDASDANDLDPIAVFANGLREGLGGGIGYNGTRYGPWQIKQADIPVPDLVGAGANSVNAQAWAWSQEGIDWQLDRMARRGARGAHGHLAVMRIVYGVEDVQDPITAVSNRVGVYDELLALKGRIWGHLAEIIDGPKYFHPPGTVISTKIVGETLTAAPRYYARAGRSWRQLVRVMGRNVPAGAIHIRLVTRRLPRSIL